MIEVLNISVLALRKSAKSLFQAFILVLFFGSIFILLGKQLYKGVLTQKCVTSPLENISEVDYALFVANSSNWLEDKNGYYLCGNGTGARPCPSNYICLKGAEINSFYVSNFNFYGSSVVTISQLMTLHFWQELYQRMLLTAGTLHVTYFVLAFYTFLYLNGLILAIITRSYKVVILELNASDKIATLAVKDTVSRCDLSKGIVKSPSCKSYELFITQINNVDNIETLSSLQGESTQAASETARSRMSSNKTSGSKSGEEKSDVCALFLKCWHATRTKLETVLSSSIFESFILMCIAINSLIMALRHSNMSSEIENFQKIAYYVFAALSLVEATLKIIAFGPQQYFSDKWNRFDFLILLSAGIEIAAFEEYSMLLIFRFLKLTKIFQQTCSLTCNYLTNAMGCILAMFSHPAVALIVFITICIVSGMQLYGTEYFHSRDRFPDQESPRWFFKDCYSSFLLVFCMLCGDWKQPMVNAVLFTSCASDLLMLLFVLTGNLVVMNLFLGVVFYVFYYRSFSASLSSKDNRSQSAINKIFCKLKGKELQTIEVAVDADQNSEAKAKMENKAISHFSSGQIINENMGRDSYRRGIKRLHGMHRNHREMEITEDTSSEYMADCCPALCYFCCSFCRPDKNPVLWQTWADLRCRLYCFVERKMFRIIIAIVIIVSVAILIVDRTYGPEYPSVIKGVKIIEPSIIVLFMLEMILKWMAYGLHKYFKSPLGRLEFVIILVYLADLLTIQLFYGQKNIFKALRSFRLLSVLQLLKSYQEIPPLPIKRNSCALGSENASRESLLRLRKVECDHFFGRHCRYRPTDTQRIFSHDHVQTDWNRSTVYTPDIQEKGVKRARTKSDSTLSKKSIPVVETLDCLPSLCYNLCPCCRRSCVFWKNWKMLRESAVVLVESKYFLGFISCIIILSCISLAMEIIYFVPKPVIMQIASYADKVLAVMFLVEVLLKLLAFGLRKYFIRPWCFIEFTVAVTSLIFVILNETGVVWLPVLKLIRVFRLLYIGNALAFNKQAKLVLRSVGQAVPSYFVALFLCLFFWTVYAVLGVFMFAEMFHSCLDNDGEILDVSYNDYQMNCMLKNGTYKNSVVNFDNVGNAYIALLQVATLQNWMTLVTGIMDNCSPSEYVKNQVYTSVYFPSFIMMSTFLTLNFFVGITLYFFVHLKKVSEKKFGNETQKLYNTAVKKMKGIKLQKAIPEPQFQLQKFLYRMVTSDNFEVAGFVFIGLHMLLIALDMYDPYPSEMFALAMIELNVFFIIIFTVECVLKIVAMRLYYFIKLWNLFDIFVLTLCILGALFENQIFVSPMLPAMLRLLRFMKSPRYLRRHARGMIPLISSLFSSIPAFLAMSILQFFVMFIYSVFGVYFFKHVKHEWDISGELNFKTFAKSLLLLFQLSTLAGWKDVLGALSEDVSCHSENSPVGHDCNNHMLAVIYIVTYLVIVYFVIVKTHLVIVLDNYESSMQELENIVLMEDYEMFAEVWQKFDPNATGIIKFCKLADLLDAMEEPFHFDKPNRFLIVSLNVPIYEGELVFYGDVMDALTRDIMAQYGHIMELPKNVPKLLDKTGRTLGKISSSLWRQRQNHCAQVIQHTWKRYTGQLVRKPCPMFYSEVRLATHGEKIDTFLACNSRFSSHASV